MMRTEYARWTSIMAKLDNRLKKEAELRKVTKTEKTSKNESKKQ